MLLCTIGRDHYSDSGDRFFCHMYSSNDAVMRNDSWPTPKYLPNCNLMVIAKLLDKHSDLWCYINKSGEIPQFETLRSP
jgi:hypothetical protein